MARHWHATQITSTAFGLAVALQACSAARLDPNSRALTLYSPTPSSTAPQGVAGGPSLLPSSKTAHRDAQAAAHQREATAQASTGADTPTGPGLPHCSSLPDPAPSRTDRWIALSLRFDKGDLYVLSFTPHRSRRFETSKRNMGRFAAELWIGCELIDRLRFDFPLLGAEPAQAAADKPSFEAAGHFETSVLVPDSDRATRLELVDRAKQTRKILDWPLRTGLPAASQK
jgi:hypothetical protein